MEELETLGVDLIMISIGTPEKGRQLINHLAIPKGSDYLYVDPENALYDVLLLNKGVKETFFSPSTPFAFLDRFTKKDGTKELTEVLSKWNKAFYIPPKQDQAFNQGGTFLFDGDDTVFAHYDESTGAHSDIDQVIRLARDRMDAKATTVQTKTIAAQ
ncbi:AhpC/TSA antioxidant enzyme [Nitzschia inconspicua]|uniref:AhpC/TSA antioxidant enzyme n=1 Tax=Nitzschia inconspicua TaxID=303405 RepID=A0A9K3LI39_9STRA|nr:AhpC/TSA antioxidant enzyme [Nitzschia inconspicua]